MSDSSAPLFRTTAPPNPEDMAHMSAQVCKQTIRLLRQRGLWRDDDETLTGDDPLADAQPLLAACYNASVTGTLMFGPRGARPMRLRVNVSTDQDSAPARHAHNMTSPHADFDIDASVRIAPNDRAGRERLCRYILRPPLANARIEAIDNDRYRLRLKRPWSDGTTHIVLAAHELIGRLVALIPPPRAHQIRFFGIFAPHAKHRAQIVPAQPEPSHLPSQDEAPSATCTTTHPPARRSRQTWAELMQRVFAIDVLACPRCDSRMQRIATITSASAIQQILHSVHRATSPPGDVPAVA